MYLRYRLGRKPHGQTETKKCIQYKYHVQTYCTVLYSTVALGVNSIRQISGMELAEEITLLR